MVLGIAGLLKVLVPVAVLAGKISGAMSLGVKEAILTTLFSLRKHPFENRD